MTPRAPRLAAIAAAVGLSAALLTACAGNDTIRVQATFDDVGDLVPGHSVQVADVRVGRITGIRLTNDFRAEVTLELDGSIAIPKASTALLRTTSLLGEKFIELRAQSDPAAGPFLEDGDVLEDAIEAPELEFVAEEAVSLLGGVVAVDVRILTQTGAEGFGGRAEELRALIADLRVISATLASGRGDVARIVERLDQAAATLAAGQDDLDGLLVNLADTTNVLVDSRRRILAALEQLTRLARVQNEEVLGPHLATLDRQLTQIDAVVGRVAASSGEVGALVDWLARFVEVIPLGIPGDFAQVYTWQVGEDDAAGASAGGGG